MCKFSVYDFLVVKTYFNLTFNYKSFILTDNFKFYSNMILKTKNIFVHKKT